MKMKIDVKDFRVQEDEKVKLKKWPTLLEPVYKSKKKLSQTPERTGEGTKLAATSSLRG